MPVDLYLELRGLRETQDRLEKNLGAVASADGLEAIWAKATLRAHRYANMVVHVQTGRLKNSLFPRVQRRMNGIYGVIGTNVWYAPIEHDRGGSHSFFERTVTEDGPGIVQMVERDMADVAKRAGG